MVRTASEFSPEEAPWERSGPALLAAQQTSARPQEVTSCTTQCTGNDVVMPWLQTVF